MMVQPDSFFRRHKDLHGETVSSSTTSTLQAAEAVWTEP